MKSEGKMVRKNCEQKRKDERLEQSRSMGRNEIQKDKMELKYFELKISHTRSKHFCVNMTSLSVSLVFLHYIFNCALVEHVRYINSLN